MANAWMQHLKAFWAKNKGKMTYKQAMVEAKKTYKKGSDSSADDKKKVKKTRRRKK